MKIYQIHKYEDSGFGKDEDTIVGSYLNEDRAKEERTKLEEENKRLVEKAKICKFCPYTADKNWNKTINQVEKENLDFSCARKELYKEPWGIWCKNDLFCRNDISFKIVEVEVIE